MANKNTIEINDDVSMEIVKMIQGKVFIQAMSGGGKSYLIRRLLEQSFGKIQHIVLDVEGEFASLREKFDYVLVGKGGDLAASPKTAALLARKILEFNFSAIIDLSELHPQERKQFVRLFLESMMNAPQTLWHDCMIVIDEAHTFAPEKGQAESTNAVIDLASRGRKRGYCGVFATQRMSKLHKDVAAECNNKLIGRTTLDIDMARAADDLGFSTKEQKLTLRHLEQGEFYAYGSAISNEVIKLKVGAVQTQHSRSKTRRGTKVTPPTAKLKSILKVLEDLPKQAEQEAKTIAELQAEIKSLKAIKSKPVVTQVVDKESVRLAVSHTTDTLAAQYGEKLAQVEQEYKLKIEEWRQYAKDFHGFFDLFFSNVKTLRIPLEVKPRAFKTLAAATTSKLPPTLVTQTAVTAPKVATLLDDVAKPWPREYSPDDKLPDGALRILNVLAQRLPMKLTKAQLATFAQMKSSSGTFGTYLSRLKQLEYIMQDGNQFFATDDGVKFVGVTPAPASTPEEVIEMWKQNLNGGALRMFEALVNIYPSNTDRMTLGSMVGMNSASGTFGEYLALLKGNGLIEIATDKTIKASPNLYV